MIKKGIIDFSGFLDENLEVVVKELSICDPDTLATQHWIFLPPKDRPRVSQQDRYVALHNRWLSTHNHGLYFDNGTMDYDALPTVLDKHCTQLNLLFAPTVEKAVALERIFGHSRSVLCLEHLGCPPPQQPLYKVIKSDKTNPPCLFHEIYARGFYCTQTAVRKLADWCTLNSEKVDMNNVESRLLTYGQDWALQSPTPLDLAEQGFVKLPGTKDSTKCLYCGLTLHQWEEGDVPAHDHETHSPCCGFLRYLAQQHKEQEEEKKNEQDVGEGKKKKKDVLAEGEDVCGCFTFTERKISEGEIHYTCYS